MKIYLAFLWLVLTSSLIIWWMYFALGLVKDQGGNVRLQNMLFLEGITLLALLVVGGGTLIYFINQQKKQTDRLREFFAAFSHDMKTAVASLRLQTESLQQDLPQEFASGSLMNRLVTDTSRILVATDNSLHFAQNEELKLLNDEIDLNDLIATLEASWPQFKINLVGSGRVKGDSRALQILFENLIHNSISHGKASEATVELASNANYVSIRVSDNGIGYSGDIEKLGESFYRPTVTSGSGLGLSIVSNLIRIMKGKGPIFSSDTGFRVSFELPRGSK